MTASLVLPFPERAASGDSFLGCCAVPPGSGCHGPVMAPRTAQGGHPSRVTSASGRLLRPCDATSRTRVPTVWFFHSLGHLHVACGYCDTNPQSSLWLSCYLARTRVSNTRFVAHEKSVVGRSTCLLQTLNLDGFLGECLTCNSNLFINKLIHRGHHWFMSRVWKAAKIRSQGFFLMKYV